MSAAIAMERHPFLHLSYEDSYMTSMGFDGNTFQKCGRFSRVGFLVIVNFNGIIETDSWVNDDTDAAFKAPYGFRPCVKTVVPVTGSVYNCTFVFNTDGNVLCYGYGVGYVHGIAVYPTSDPLQ